MLSVLVSCTKKEKQVSQEKNSSSVSSANYLVTFIELGSVRCIPCKMMQPIMAEIEKEYAGRVKVVFYDVWTEAHAPYAEFYKIRVIPTQIFLDKNGREYYRHEGYFPKDELVKVLELKLKETK
ncbi:MAG: thioredoxin family protein [Brevinematia bacterium]